MIKILYLCNCKLTFAYTMKRKLYRKYWEERKKSLDNPKGKRLAVDEILNILKTFHFTESINILDIGCGEGYILKMLSDSLKIPIKFTGLDRSNLILQNAKKTTNTCKDIHDFSFLNINISNDKWADNIGKFDIIIAINVFHEIYSEFLFRKKDNIKSSFLKIIDSAFKLLKENGVLLIFDGIESDYSFFKNISFRLLNDKVKSKFSTFENDYKILPVEFNRSDNDIISCNYRDFTRFITKLKFIDTETWDIERKESYQYFTEKEFLKMFYKNNMNIICNNSFICDIDEWEKNVTIIDKNISFPSECICIIGKKRDTKYYGKH